MSRHNRPSYRPARVLSHSAKAAFLGLILVAQACSSDKPNPGQSGGTESSGGSDTGSGGSSSGSGGKGAATGGKGTATGGKGAATGGSANTSGGSTATGGDDPGPVGGQGEGGGNVGSVSVGQHTGTVATTLPVLPTLTNVTATVMGDSLTVNFDPVDGASDYRVYVLPKDADVSAAAGALTVRNATYRCAGNRMSPPSAVDITAPGNGWVATIVNGTVGGFKRATADATLGYVYPTPGDGRIPVYALGDPDKDADNNCYEERWKESRSKRYVTSDSERATLIAARWRDDGIAFYVPEAAGATTRPIYVDESNKEFRYYFGDGAEANAHAAKVQAFSALKAAADGAVPLMRVFYQNYCGHSHDEIVATKSRFDRAFNQGDKLPEFSVHWSGLTGKTMLVVEALDSLCPYIGQLAPKSAPAYVDKISYAAWTSIDDARAASASGEVFINGQGDPKAKPKPIARSFVEVSPTPAPDLEWFTAFGPSEPLGTFAEKDCAATQGNNCFQQFRQASENFDAMFFFPESNRHQFDVVQGELWAAYADLQGDANAKFRLMPQKPAKIAADSFLYVTMEVDSFTTGRRYPQIVISNQGAPIDWNFYTGASLVVQTFKGEGSPNWPNAYMLEVCDKRVWDVNQQCPSFPDFRKQLDPQKLDPKAPIGLAPNDEVGEHSGVDRSTRFEVYTSTKRTYLFLDGKPYGCAILPTAGVPPAGPVYVTFGNVLYHSDADDLAKFSAFLETNSKRESHRHFDNLGFKSGVAAPPWNESLLPCFPSSTMAVPP